jgi:hypothetical protein
MLGEISAVIIAHLSTLPQHFRPTTETTDANVLTSCEIFSPDALKELVYKAGRQTYNNISSMNQDVRAGRRTEIDYITGWILNRGEDLGLSSPLNDMVRAAIDNRKTFDLKTESDALCKMTMGSQHYQTPFGSQLKSID